MTMMHRYILEHMTFQTMVSTKIAMALMQQPVVLVHNITPVQNRCNWHWGASTAVSTIATCNLVWLALHQRRPVPIAIMCLI